MQCVTLSLFRFARLADRLWVLGQMAAARPALARLPGVEFWKLCGSGTGEGFTPRPNTAVWAILAAWRDEGAARAALDGAAVFRRWRGRAAEDWTVFMAPRSARGRWGGVEPFRPGAAAAGAPAHIRPSDASPSQIPPSDTPPSDTPPSGPLAVLTRATLRPAHILRFWARGPAISAAIGANRDVAFKIGIGELPWVQQATFSVWPDARAMTAFAHAPGPHAEAIRAVRRGGWFAEELYARLSVTGTAGTWGGRDPLAGLVAAAAPAIRGAPPGVAAHASHPPLGVGAPPRRRGWGGAAPPAAAVPPANATAKDAPA